MGMTYWVEVKIQHNVYDIFIKNNKLFIQLIFNCPNLNVSRQLVVFKYWVYSDMYLNTKIIFNKVAKKKLIFFLVYFNTIMDPIIVKNNK